MNKITKIAFLALSIFTSTLFFACNFESNSNDDSNDSSKNETLTYSPIKNIKSAASSETIVLVWQNPETYYGVKLEMSPAAGNLATAQTCSKETNTFTVTGLDSATKYTFTFTSLNNKQEETSEKATISITTAKSSSTESTDETPTETDTTAPEDITKLKYSIEDLVVTLSWKVSVSDDVFGYLISYEKEKIATIEASRSVLSEAMKKNTVFVSPETKEYSTSVKAGSSYTFTVKTVDVNGNISDGVSTDKITIQENVGPEFSDRTEGLNYIFSTASLADITLTITRTEWNNLLAYYDQNYRNEEYIHADFKMKKGKNTWEISDIGLRLRGNTSRKRPQDGENYYQSHFKLDFEEWLSSSGEERKLAGCMKGLNLKRFKEDPTYTREVFGYNFFRKNGIWTAPRAAYAHLFINIEEDNGSQTELDYGVYAMIEEINKQYLKERTLTLQTGDSLGGGEYSDNKGDLWKCCWQKNNGPSLYTDYNVSSSFGVEEIYLDESKSLRFDYDLKTNKDSLSIARNNFIDFIKELNALDSEEKIKSFYESKMDVDLFIKTYACNVLLGMDDDYWRNKNNYYFYFDTNGKAYFIPYDYDNILGTNCFNDTVTRNPLEWGEGVNNAPLIEKLLSVYDYKQKYIDYLTQLSEETSFVQGSQTEIQRLQSLVENYIYSKDITYSDTSSSITDDCASWCSNYGKYKLLSGDETNNYFRAKAKSVKTYCNPKYVSLTFDLNVPSDTTSTADFYYYDDENSSTSDSHTVRDVLSGKVITTCYSSVSLYGYRFLGWYTQAEGGSLIETATGTMTVYAHYTDLPYKYWEETDSNNETTVYLKFTFVPEDFGYSSDDINRVVIASDFNSWSSTQPPMTKENDGTYTYTYSGDYSTIHSHWYGYKFVVNGNKWLGWTNLKYGSYLSSEYRQQDGDKNFIVAELN